MAQCSLLCFSLSNVLLYLLHFKIWSEPYRSIMLWLEKLCKSLKRTALSHWKLVLDVYCFYRYSVLLLTGDFILSSIVNFCL